MTDVPCVGELQCVALPGTACNLALAEPRCQRVRCGSVGSPCSSAGLCVADSPCLGDVCRTADEAQDRCLRSCLSVEVVELGSYEPCSAEQVRQGCERACEGYPLSGWWAAECPLAAQGPEYWGGFINVLYCDAARGVCQADVNCSNIMHPPLGGCG